MANDAARTSTIPLARRAVGEPILRRASVLLACVLLLACGSSGGGGGGGPQPPADPSHNPIGDAYAALVAADHDALPGVIAALDDAIALDPTDGASAFYAGTMRLWRLTRLRADPAGNAVEMAFDAQATLALLESAHALRPASEHAAAFLGVAQVTVGAVVGDQARVERGRAVLEAAVPLHPAYVSGVRAIALGALPRDHPAFPEAIVGMNATLAACGLEGTGEHGLTFAYPGGAQPSARRVCNDEGIVAHVWEGIFLTFGDIVVKHGDAARARELYANARSAPDFDTWTLRDLLDQRIAQAGERAALYLDEDPSNDPRTWMEEERICTGCHASTD